MGDRICVVDRCLDKHSPSLGALGESFAVNLVVAGSVFSRTLDEWTVERIREDFNARAFCAACTPEEAQGLVEQAFAAGVMDDRGLLFAGTRRLTMPMGEAIPADSFITVGCVPQRLEQESERDEIITAMRDVVRRHADRSAG